MDVPPDPDPSSELHYLDPSPVDDEPPLSAAEKGSYFPKSTSSFGLSGGHGATYYLRRIQKYSSYTFSAFLALHLANTSLIPLALRSASAADEYLLLTRPYYQSPIAEPLLVFLPIVAHVGSGVALRVHRRRQMLARAGAENRADRKKVKFPPISSTSIIGFTLAPLAGLHILVNRLTPLWSEGGSSSIGLTYVGHGMSRHPGAFALAYAPLVATTVWHIVWGMARWRRWTPENVRGGERPKRRRWWLLQAVSFFGFGLWMQGMRLSGMIGETKGWMGSGFDELYRNVPVLGAWY
ncbi:MAG: hypothetical protein M1834_001235 [Cirrosporium novae-zelandiae]|nr:MAG: hypothetical protein M1834_001235 [Cirrosporium novae-zelandiae]